MIATRIAEGLLGSAVSTYQKSEPASILRVITSSCRGAQALTLCTPALSSTKTTNRDTSFRIIACSSLFSSIGNEQPGSLISQQGPRHQRQTQKETVLHHCLHFDSLPLLWKSLPRGSTALRLDGSLDFPALRTPSLCIRKWDTRPRWRLSMLYSERTAVQKGRGWGRGRPAWTLDFCCSMG